MIYIWVRRTVDWGDEDAALEQITDAWLMPKIQLWNATFNLSYQQFRRRVADIAELNHSKVADARRVDWDEIPDGSVVLAVDDDDWVAPDAGRVLERERERGPDPIGFLWESRWIEVPIDLRHRLHLLQRRLFPGTPPKWICAANNYAMVKSAETKPLLSSHVRASRWFDARANDDESAIRKVASELSIANRTLASQTSLRGMDPAISRAHVMRKFRCYKSLYEKPPPAALEWCRPYLRLMSELMADLNVVDHG